MGWGNLPHGKGFSGLPLPRRRIIRSARTSAVLVAVPPSGPVVRETPCRA
jgi:hypothetical protein